MEELFQTPEGIVTFFAAIFGGSTGLGSIIAAIIAGIKNKRYSAVVASSSAKDAQIMELKDMASQLLTVMGLLMSAFATQQLSSMALPADVKRQIVEIASKVEKLTDIKLDSSVEKAIEIMTTVNPQAITEAQKQEILETANKAQEALDVVNKKADDIASTLII